MHFFKRRENLKCMSPFKVQSYGVVWFFHMFMYFVILSTMKEHKIPSPVSQLGKVLRMKNQSYKNLKHIVYASYEWYPFEAWWMENLYHIKIIVGTEICKLIFVISEWKSVISAFCGFKGCGYFFFFHEWWTIYEM